MCSMDVSGNSRPRARDSVLGRFRVIWTFAAFLSLIVVNFREERFRQNGLDIDYSVLFGESH